MRQEHELILQWKAPHARAEGTVHPSGETVLDRFVGGAAPNTADPVGTWRCCPTITGPWCGGTF
ncbi:hypothetical protein [Nonomuraea soli]|uniref:Uncharacterized protein n=1 Tax=Nonomuraea soli TaxID=1032476 RepID=A0A7W0HSQ5_9ACTN|nr:hypothetical protein [Nonomuraea soli]MBA2894323.1 hypothetical protein [Nonomuraea soli]